VLKYHQMSVRMISDTIGISVCTVDTIVTDDLKLHKVYVKFVPKIHSSGQRKLSGGGSIGT